MMNYEETYRLIEMADRRRDEIVLCLMGKPGIGKTDAIERFARDNHRNVVHIIASQVLPNEVSGMTMPNAEDGTMDVFDHERLGNMRSGDILFLDELLKGQQQVLNACLTMVQERRLMSGRKLPDIMIIAAANPLASPSQLPLEIRQRFMFVEVEWDAEEWMGYICGEIGIEKSRELELLCDRIDDNLGSVMKSWNVLTPRTATKLLKWMQTTGCDHSVADYINDEYGREIGDLIRKVVSGKMTVDPTIQWVENMKGILKPIEKKALEYTDNLDEEALKADKMRELLDIGRRLNNIEDKVNGSKCPDKRADIGYEMQDLMDALSKLDEWPEIQKALEDIEIEM